MIVVLRGYFATIVLILANMMASTYAKADNYILVFGLSDSDEVFEEEAVHVGTTLNQHYRSGHDALVYVNTKDHGGVTKDWIFKQISNVTNKIDNNKDVLILYFASHGTPDGLVVRDHDAAGRPRTETLTPFELGLYGSRIKHKVIIVSSCYAGVFGKLASPNTLVFTASDANHTTIYPVYIPSGKGYTSAECDVADPEAGGMTYFGYLLLGGISVTGDLNEAFMATQSALSEFKRTKCDTKGTEIQKEMCGLAIPRIYSGAELVRTQLLKKPARNQ